VGQKEETVLTFTIETRSGPRPLQYSLWDGHRLRSSRRCPIAFDTETELIQDERESPRLALATASDGRTHVVIHPDRLAEFLLAHAGEHLVGHNVQFDFWVVDRHLREAGDEAARRVLWDVCHSGRLRDTQVLDMLIQLATGRFRKTGDAGKGKRKDDDTKKVYPASLAELATDYTIYRVNKKDPYRTRFGELVGLSEAQWAGVEPGFFEYAVRDAAVTHRLYPALADAAYKLMLEHGFDRSAERYEIRPDAIEKFGYLSEVIQVKASIALAYMFRRGVRVKLEKVRALEAAYRAELDQVVAEMERDHREVLTYGKKDGKLELTPKSQTPSLGTKKLDAKLVKVVEDLTASGHEIRMPLSKGKKKGTSHRMEDWLPHAELHPFLKCWSRMAKLSKLLGYLAAIQAERVHGEYNLLMRTGRTSCSAPRSESLPGLNLQQVPRGADFRSLFVADPGHALFVCDFSAAELRTLAAVCKARLGRSRLGEVIAAGQDPHAFTAALVQGMTPEAFLELKEHNPKRFKDLRQAAKALNFGIPGGLGAESLVNYARANYGVTLTAEQAVAFKRKVIDEIYPELNDRDGYLADQGMAALARNLGVTEREAWEVLDRSGKKNPIAARGVARVVRGESTASEHYQAGVWDGLLRLARVSRSPDADLLEQIAREQGGRGLHARLYRQSAVTLTGRVRAGVTFTASKNTPFQALCADGGKVGLWNLLYADFDLYAYVHDEGVVQLPAETAEQDAHAAKKIMTESMEEVMGHGIPAACDWVIASCWTKP
jgi:hypothetical protein